MKSYLPGRLVLLKRIALFSLLPAGAIPPCRAYGQAVPRPYKTVHIMMENRTYAAVIGTADSVVHPRTGAPFH